MSTTKYRFARPGRCVALVWKKDTYRLSRGRGFKMHYTESQCSRRPVEGSEFCWQHQPEGAAASRCETCGEPATGKLWSGEVTCDEHAIGKDGTAFGETP